jgi:hypothetical protein
MLEARMKRSLLFVLCCVLFVLPLSSCAQYRNVKEKVGTEWKKATGKSAVRSGKWTPVEASALEDPFKGTCAMSTHQDEYAGFAIGYPKGWLLDYSTETIVVSKNEKQMVGALVFPARLRRDDVPAERLAMLFAEGLGRSIARKGGSTELTDQKTSGKVATATILATIDGVELKGPLQVVEQPGFVTLKLYWAPKSDFDKEESTLKQVLTCYQRKTLITAKHASPPPEGRVTKVGYPAAKATAPVQALQPHRGKFMNISMPAGWVIKDENDHGIDVMTPDKGTGVGFGWFMKPHQPNPMAMVKQHVAGYQGTLRRLEYVRAAQRGWIVAEGEWEAKGTGTHGIERVAEGPRGIAMSWTWMGPTATWKTLVPTLEAIAASAQITPTAMANVQAEARAALAAVPRFTPSYTTASADSSSGGGSDDLMSGWQDREDRKDRANQDFDDYIRGNERVTNSAGDTLIAPTSAWNSTGPQGAGYYEATPNGPELLTPVPPQSE